MKKFTEKKEGRRRISDKCIIEKEVKLQHEMIIAFYFISRLPSSLYL